MMRDKVDPQSPAAVDPNPVPILHPGFLALYPVLGLYAHNADKINLAATIRPSLLLIFGAIFLAILLRMFYTDHYKAGFGASILVISGFSGWNILTHAMNLTLPLVAGYSDWGYYFAYALAFCAIAFVVLRRRKAEGQNYWKRIALVAFIFVAILALADGLLTRIFDRGPVWYMVIYWLVVTIGLVLLARSPYNFRNLTPTANWFGVILLGLSVVNVLYNKPEQIPFSPPPPLEGTPVLAEDGSTPPDIYFIVLGGHGRADVHLNRYAYNEGPFIQTMADLGFDHAPASLANYPNSVFSLASCLNMEYLSTLHGADTDLNIQTIMRDIHNNRVYALLKQQGYEITVFAQGLDFLERNTIIDETLKPRRSLSEFEIVLLQNCVVAPVIQAYHFLRHQSRADTRDIFERGRIYHALERLEQIPTEPADTPRFVLAYFTIPEPPYLFKRDKAWPSSSGQFLYAGRPDFPGSVDDYKQGYIDQLIFTNNIIQEVAGRIIEDSPAPPVIALVSAHGPSSLLSAGLTHTFDASERFGNMMFIHFPEKEGEAKEEGVYESLSLVNAFRVIFNRVAGADFPLLSDDAYLIHLETPIRFEKVPIPIAD